MNYTTFVSNMNPIENHKMFCLQIQLFPFLTSRAELCDKRWFGFEIEYLLMARLFRIQYQNQYLYFLAIITDTDINTAQWVIFECETPFIFSCLGPQHPCKHLIATLFNWKVSTGIGLSLF